MDTSGEQHTMCETCLSGERRLSRLGGLRAVYVALTDSDPRADPRVCWECVASLRRAARFRLRAARAQAWFLSTGGCEPPDLKPASSLRATAPALDVEINPDTDDSKLEGSTDLAHVSKSDYFDNHSDCNTMDAFQDTVPNGDDRGKYKVDASDEQYDIPVETFVKLKRGRPKTKVKQKTTTKRSKTRTMSRLIKLNDSEVLKYRQEERDMKSYQNAKYKCDTCVLILKKSNIDRHMDSAHGLKSHRYSCDICGIRAKTKSRLERHVREHYNLYGCFKCSFKSISKFRIRYHSEVVHKLKKTYQCTSCRQRFTDEGQLREHLEYKKKRKRGYLYECDTCGERLRTRLKMEKHFRVHVVNECSVCGRSFKTRYTLNLHYQRMHAVAAVPSEVYCVECNKQFVTMMAFETHLSVVHSSKPKTRIPCTACDKTFSSKVYLNNHYQLLHLKKTDFFCEICNKYFSKKSGLKVHTMRVHEGVPVPKNDVCNICGRAFSSKVILKHHIRTHTGERPHKCDYCSAAFAQSTAMKNHVKNIHLRVSH